MEREPIPLFNLEGHCAKSLRIWSFSDPYFPAFGINADQKNSEYEHFSSSGSLCVK